MKFRANFQYKPINFQMDDCQIEKVVELTAEEFSRLKVTPLDDQAFIAENKSCMFSKDGVMHCLLALDREGSDGVLIESEGHDYPRYAAYVPGMRHILHAEMGYGQPSLRVRDILPLLKGGGMIFLCHEEAEQSVLAENLRLLTGAGQEDHTALLNARVSGISETPEGTEVVLTDVDPEELVRFNEAYDAFMEVEQTMGPTMG